MNIIPILLRARKAIQEMTPYKSARSTLQQEEGMILLDANECPFPPYDGANNYNRYADQQPKILMEAAANLYGIQANQIMAARGADECIDILVRTFCEVGKDNIVITSPTFPMYAHAALLQEIHVKDVPLTVPDFSFDTENVIRAIDGNTKIIFICSPNNPTGSIVEEKEIRAVCEAAKDKALVVLDEIYIEYADIKSCMPLLKEYTNLVILRSLSKAYAGAGLRFGFTIGHPDVIATLRKVLAIYPLPQTVIQAAMVILSDPILKDLETKRKKLLSVKLETAKKMASLPCVVRVFPTQTNFFLVKFHDAEAVMKACAANKIILRNQSHYHPSLAQCIRFSCGTDEEMERLLKVLEGISVSKAA